VNVTKSFKYFDGDRAGPITVTGGLLFSMPRTNAIGTQRLGRAVGSWHETMLLYAANVDPGVRYA
jgi:hypothetical protein